MSVSSRTRISEGAGTEPRSGAALSRRLLDEYAAVSDSLPAGVVSAERRHEAIQALAARGLPTARDENWRYTNLRPLERARFVPAAAAAAAALPGPSELPAGLDGFARYTYVDGVFAPQLSSPAERKGTGLTVRHLRQEGAAAPSGQVTVSPGAPARAAAMGRLPEARLALLNEAFATDIAAIHVTGAGDALQRMELIFIAAAGADAGASYPRVHVTLDPGARLVLVERHVSAGGGAEFVNSAVAVEVGQGAQLDHYRLQKAGVRSTFLDTLSAVLSADARYGLLAVNTGGLSARCTTHVQMAGPGAELALSVAALGDRQQVQDHFALVEHIAPRARTEQTFRGIASGRARVAFNGKITAHESAAGTDSRQSLRGLLAGPDAEIDVRPQLEIYTDEVRCSHGATAGKLDADMLFYLLSRGLSAETAQRLLKWAFLEDVVAKIGIPELRRQIEHDLAGQMPDAASLKELL
ncbi:MAG TPA: SufD family Fe-S cluster assembly protein [Steroidobacteraceae bacterium]|nr:SufD family Fe-S cluster assembly protein [Steroidobacteraceae bacterium]